MHGWTPWNPVKSLKKQFARVQYGVYISEETECVILTSPINTLPYQARVLPEQDLHQGLSGKSMYSRLTAYSAWKQREQTAELIPRLAMTFPANKIPTGLNYLACVSSSYLLTLPENYHIFPWHNTTSQHTGHVQWRVNSSC